MKIVFIGTGKIASAVITGIFRSNIILVVGNGIEIAKQTAKKLKKKFKFKHYCKK